MYKTVAAYLFDCGLATGTAYVAATSASVLTAVAFNKLVASSPKLSAGIIGRFVPLIAGT
jgi:hypothetical protein